MGWREMGLLPGFGAAGGSLPGNKEECWEAGSYPLLLH